MADNENEIFCRLGRIERLTERIDERTAQMQQTDSDHETRIRTLEAESAKRKGFIAAASSLSSLLTGGLLWLLKQITHNS